MSCPDPERLRRVLGNEDLDWLLTRIRTRLERGLALDGTVTLEHAGAAQRQAAAKLLGRRPGRGSSLTVPLPALEDSLRRAGLAPDLRSAVEEVSGAVCERATRLAEAERAWAAALAPASSAAEARPELGAWVGWLERTGILRRLSSGDPARGAELVESAVAVLDRLPAQGMGLSVLAARAAGGGHALDPGRPLATLALRAAAALGDVPLGEGTRVSAERRRTVWAAVGVLDGELSNPVLTLNLPGDERSATGRALAALGAAGEPAHLSARALLREPPRPALAGQDVFVCENPAVVAATAEGLGPASAPLVCASGHPGAAATVLLRSLSASGARLRYHGDFDWPGLAITEGVLDRFGALPWRMGAGDYLSAAARGGETLRALRGQPVGASWDAALAPAMRSRGVAVEEETVLEELLEDLAR